MVGKQGVGYAEEYSKGLYWDDFRHPFIHFLLITSQIGKVSWMA